MLAIPQIHPMLFIPLPLHTLHPGSGLSFLPSKPFLILQGLVQVKLNRAKLREKTGLEHGNVGGGVQVGVGEEWEPWRHNGLGCHLWEIPPPRALGGLLG